MLPRIELARADVPGGGTLRLMQRGGDFAIMLGGNELMSSRVSGSEEAMATLAIERLARRDGVRMLIGGLGMGFTLRTALTALDARAAITVAELVPAVVDWGRGPMAELFGGCLDDPRVEIRTGDVARIIAERAGAYDAILLDVDNGPDGLTRQGNGSLYGRAGISAAKRALAPGGVLSVWSAAPDPYFTRRLESAGFAVQVVLARADRGVKGARHHIWVAAKPG